MNLLTLLLDLAWRGWHLTGLCCWLRKKCHFGHASVCLCLLRHLTVERPETLNWYQKHPARMSVDALDIPGFLREELLWGTAETVCYHSAWWKCYNSLEYNGTINVGSLYHYCDSSFGQRFLWCFCNSPAPAWNVTNKSWKFLHHIPQMYNIETTHCMVFPLLVHMLMKPDSPADICLFSTLPCKYTLFSAQIQQNLFKHVFFNIAVLLLTIFFHEWSPEKQSLGKKMNLWF